MTASACAPGMAAEFAVTCPDTGRLRWRPANISGPIERTVTTSHCWSPGATVAAGSPCCLLARRERRGTGCAVRRTHWVARRRAAHPPHPSPSIVAHVTESRPILRAGRMPVRNGRSAKSVGRPANRKSSEIARVIASANAAKTAAGQGETAIGSTAAKAIAPTRPVTTTSGEPPPTSGCRRVPVRRGAFEFGLRAQPDPVAQSRFGHRLTSSGVT